MIKTILIVIALCFLIIGFIIEIIKFIIKLKKLVKQDKEMFNKYKTYDTSKGFGNAEEWKSGFNKTFGDKKAFDFMSEEAKDFDSFGKTKFKGQKVASQKKEGLEYCKNSEELKSEYRRLMKKYHPDSAGLTVENLEMTKKLTERYTVLKKKFKKLGK